MPTIYKPEVDVFVDDDNFHTKCVTYYIVLVCVI
jgi:hypothetical protein